jgi:8-oxo-dGTP diphosphatase
MTRIRHFTASAIVFDDRDRVLLVHHNRVGLWLYPGGHIDPDEDPAQAAQREVLEETGVYTQVISDELFIHPAVTTHASPYAIIEMDVTDTKVGPHRHIDLLYVLRATSVELAAQLDEIGAARWVHIADIPALDTPVELPALVADAVRWATKRRPVDDARQRPVIHGPAPS